MPIVELRRMQSSPEGTFSKVFVDGKFLCWAGELPKDKSLPKGEYEANLKKNKKYKLYYEVKINDVKAPLPIHVANFCGDASRGWHTNIDCGMILGDKMGYLGNQKCVLRSKEAVDRFKLLVGEKQIKLLVK